MLWQAANNRQNVRWWIGAVSGAENGAGNDDDTLVLPLNVVAKCCSKNQTIGKQASGGVAQYLE